MSLFQRIINDWATSFGLAPLHDVDLPDEPSDSAIAAALRPLRDEPTNPVSQPDLRVGTDIEASASSGMVHRLSDGPTAPRDLGLTGAVGHHTTIWCSRSHGCQSSEPEPTKPTDWQNIRRDVEHLRSVLQEALLWLDEIDPSRDELARVAMVTDIRRKRDRSSRT